MFTTVEMLEDGAVFLAPAMFFRSVKERIFCLPDVGGVTARAFVVVNNAGVTDQTTGCICRFLNR